VINLAEVNQALAKTESDIKKFTDEHNAYLKELGVNLLSINHQISFILHLFLTSYI
jgi:hypothetical protein